MENTTILHQSHYRWGLGILGISFCIFLLADLFPIITNDGGIGLFMLHYLITASYFLSIAFSGKLRKGRGGLPHVIIFLLLFLISAFALNCEMEVFYNSAPWLQVALLLTSANLLLSVSFHQLPAAVRIGQIFLLAVGAMLYLYLAIYLLPLYAFGLAGTLAIGIGIHVFVPLLLFIYTVKTIRRIMQSAIAWQLSLAAGIAIPLVVVTIFCLHWNNTQRHLSMAYHGATLPGKAGFPAWAEALQHIPDNGLTEKVIKADIVYAVASTSSGFSFWNPPAANWEEQRVHDPLVMAATWFSGTTKIPRDERILMLQTLNNNRHGAEQRLWSGKHLQTTHINTTAQIWPTMHMAYTEKVITVANTAGIHRWGAAEEEAIYIFSLPEGSVVSSLSLWIDGKEEKSVLTTKAKAERAYNTIVGREARDPSVIHWLEGNRVSVRVFPVMAGNNRVFKIGITSPLPVRDGLLHYENFTFRGPTAADATEQVRVTLMEQAPGAVRQAALRKQVDNGYTYEGKYRADWSLAMEAGSVAPHAYIHGQAAFGIYAYAPPKVKQNFTTVYADVHAQWNRAEWEQLRQSAGKRTLKVYHNGWQTITHENEEALFEKLHKKPFSLFPFQALVNPQHSLVVTKPGANTPSLTELKESAAFERLQQQVELGVKYNLFHIGPSPSLYIHSLRELRIFNYEQGSMQDLVYNLSHGVMAANIENESQSVIYDAGLVISKNDDLSLNNAPDHLLRLFAYNHIMQQGGLRMLTDTAADNSILIQLAEYAHIVSPLSSMVVLERKADYERFDIDTEQKGLGNATTQSSGAVPEPHEWALIIIGALLLFYFRFQPKMNALWLKK